MYGVLLLRGWGACCIPFNKHTEEGPLAEEKQEDEREADDDEWLMIRCITGKY